MTTAELSQLYYLRLEVERDKRELVKVDHWISKAPRPFIEGLVELRSILASQLEKYSHERDRLERFIADIDDPYTRKIFELRFVDGLTWVQIAMKMGYYASEDCYKKIAYRYLKQVARAKDRGQ